MYGGPAIPESAPGAEGASRAVIPSEGSKSRDLHLRLAAQRIHHDCADTPVAVGTGERMHHYYVHS